MNGAKNVGILDWFAVFALLFTVLLILKWFFPALVVVIIFSAIFAWYYHTYLDVPRTEEEKIILSNWWAWLERRWREHPPTVRSIEYYVNHAPLDQPLPVVLLELIGLAILLLAIVALLLPFFVK